MLVAGGFSVPCPPRVVLHPSFACTYGDLGARFPTPSCVSVTQRSTLVLQGPGPITVRSLALDGALVVDACEGAVVGEWRWWMGLTGW